MPLLNLIPDMLNLKIKLNYSTI